MIKLGVWRPDQFYPAPPQSPLDRIYYALSRTRVSFHLLTTPRQPSLGDIQFFERLLPYVCLSSGVYRTTYRQRFKDLDPLVNGILSRYFAVSEKLLVEDWAASDCLTSSEWAKSLLPLFPQLNFVASDLLLFLIEARETGTEKRFIFEPDGNPLQYVDPPFVIRLGQPEPIVFPFNWLLYQSAQRRWRNARTSWNIPESWKNSLTGGPIQQGKFELRKLSLIHPEALQVVDENPHFMVHRHSIFEPSTRANHVIRSMNIYNRAYFSEEQLRQGVRCVGESLLPGGIWIVGRTIDKNATVHEVTIFQKGVSGEFEILDRVGSGSEIEKLALTVKLKGNEPCLRKA
jgi:hypothetical protein